MDTYCVYKHTSPNGKVYIGITKMKLSDRWRNGKGYERNEYFYKAILKYGWDSFKHEIIADGLTMEQAEAEEIRLIQLFRSNDKRYGYNLTTGGECKKQYSLETKEKIRQKAIGRIVSEETKQKMRAIHTGQWTGDKNPCFGKTGEQNPFYGRHHSEKTKMEHSERMKGRYTGEKNPRALKVECIETGEIFDYIKQAAEKYGIWKAGISKCCKGTRNTCGGFHWRYVVKE